MSNPKEKAKELVNRFSIYVDFTDNKFNDCEKVIFSNSKNCALIVVDELINQCYDYRLIDLGCSHGFWVDVKKEIENLNEIN